MDILCLGFKMRSCTCWITMIITLFVLTICINLSRGDCGPACLWLPWHSWSSCSKQCGGGSQSRDRMLCCNTDWLKEPGLCNSMCDKTNSGYYDYKKCNTFCYQGSYTGSRCDCSGGYYGICCEHEITCGKPNSISNGAYTGDNFKYGRKISYYCNNKYELINGDSIHTCDRANSYSSVGYWKGRVPHCAFVQSCESSPCQNGAACVNGYDSYSCSCLPGWSGTNCQFDIQPPIIIFCPSNITIHSEEPKTTVDWLSATFTDPLGSSFAVSSNYQGNQYNFPWGEYIIQFVAVKDRNGLKAECTFSVSVYPFPCDALQVPENGSFACNGWNGRYTEVCALFCESKHDVPVQVNIEHLFVCGASGNWMPMHTNVSCTENRIDPPNQHFYEGDCQQNTNSQNHIRQTYLDVLKASDYAELCTTDTWAPQCVSSGVKLIC